MCCTHIHICTYIFHEASRRTSPRRLTKPPRETPHARGGRLLRAPALSSRLISHAPRQQRAWFLQHYACLSNRENQGQLPTSKHEFDCPRKHFTEGPPRPSSCQAASPCTSTAHAARPYRTALCHPFRTHEPQDCSSGSSRPQF